MDEKCYKPNLLFQIVSAIIKAVILIIAVGFFGAAISIISVFFLPVVKAFFATPFFPLLYRIKYLIPKWVFLLIPLIISIIHTFYFQNIKITIRDRNMYVKRRNKEDVYSFHNYKIIDYEDKEDNSILGQINSLYRIKLVSAYGDVEEVICYSFSKEKFMELKRNISRIYEKMEEWK